MIQTFDELKAIAASAKTNRLSRPQYFRMMASFPYKYDGKRLSTFQCIHMLTKEHMLGALRCHEGKRTFKGFLVKIPPVLYAFSSYRVIKKYPATCAYSDTLIDDFLNHTDEYYESYNLLSDEWSKKVFVNLLTGEMLMDGRYGIPFARPKKGGGGNYCVDLSTDEPFFKEGEVFVDCGAYTGDTLREFIDENKTPKQYYGFEPDSKNFLKAQETLSSSDVPGTVYNAGVYNHSGTLRFSNSDASSKVTEDGETTVDVLTIDEVIKDAVTVIKMDIEGSEYEALEGCANLIKNHKPKLAICIYHKVGDFRKLPLLIKRLNPDYSQFYIRYLSVSFTKIGFLEACLFVR